MLNVMKLIVNVTLPDILLPNVTIPIFDVTLPNNSLHNVTMLTMIVSQMISAYFSTTLYSFRHLYNGSTFHDFFDFEFLSINIIKKVHFFNFSK